VLAHVLADLGRSAAGSAAASDTLDGVNSKGLLGEVLAQARSAYIAAAPQNTLTPTAFSVTYTTQQSGSAHIPHFTSTVRRGVNECACMRACGDKSKFCCKKITGCHRA
jgi:hypothetical protein